MAEKVTRNNLGGSDTVLSVKQKVWIKLSFIFNYTKYNMQQLTHNSNNDKLGGFPLTDGPEVLCLGV